MTITRSRVAALKTDNSDPLKPLVAPLVTFLFPITALGYRGFSIGMGLTVLLLIPMLPSVSRYRHGWSVLWVFIGALLTAPLLVQISLADGWRVLDMDRMIRTMLTLGTAALAVVLLLWCRDCCGLRRAALTFGLGALAQALINTAAWQGNAWKYALAWPVAVVLLALGPRQLPRTGVLAGLAVLSVVFDFRSFAALSVIALLLVAWRKRPTTGPTRTLRPLLAAGAVGVLVLQLGTWLAVEGALGAEIQSRSIAQSEGERSLVVGARPEFSASVALAQSHPIGFGPGVVPSIHDVGVALAGLESVGANTSGAYVHDYLFGDGFELHSIAGDLWVNFGPFGVLLACLLGGVLLLGLGRSLSRGGVDGLTMFLVVVGVWDLAFSPLGNLSHVVLALAVLLPLRAERTPVGAGSAPVDQGS